LKKSKKTKKVFKNLGKLNLDHDKAMEDLALLRGKDKDHYK
jgi:hypothetical protein